MRYKQAKAEPPNSAANSLPNALKFRCRRSPQPISKLLNEITFSTSGGVFPRLICVLSLIAGKCRSIPARQVDLVEQRPTLLEAPDVVEDDRSGGRGVGEGGDMG